MTELIPTIALSFSRWSDFDQCPHKFRSKYITKSYPDDSDNPAFVKGNAIHKQLEDYVDWKHNEDGDPPTMGQYTKAAVPMIDKLWTKSGGRMTSEKQIAVDQDWKKCQWFDKPRIVKYRAIIDCMVFLSDEHLLIIDWKSGKVREYEDGDTTQLKLTAVIMFSLYPNIKRITTTYMFVEHKKTVPVDFTRDQLEPMREPFDKAHHTVNTEEKWPFKKNKYCHWCHDETCPIKK
jgi:CRISPR/Cas system-associated exonuclease Cas4 (RecB family)